MSQTLELLQDRVSTDLTGTELQVNGQNCSFLFIHFRDRGHIKQNLPVFDLCDPQAGHSTLLKNLL